MFFELLFSSICSLEFGWHLLELLILAPPCSQLWHFSANSLAYPFLLLDDYHVMNPHKNILLKYHRISFHVFWSSSALTTSTYVFFYSAICSSIGVTSTFNTRALWFIVFVPNFYLGRTHSQGSLLSHNWCWIQHRNLHARSVPRMMILLIILQQESHMKLLCEMHFWGTWVHNLEACMDLLVNLRSINHWYGYAKHLKPFLRSKIAQLRSKLESILTWQLTQEILGISLFFALQCISCLCFTYNERLYLGYLTSVETYYLGSGSKEKEQKNKNMETEARNTSIYNSSTLNWAYLLSILVANC